MSESNGRVGSPRSLRAARRNSGGLRNRGLLAGIGLDQAGTDKRLELAYGLRNTRAVPMPVLPEIVEMAG